MLVTLAFAKPDATMQKGFGMWLLGCFEFNIVYNNISGFLVIAYYPPIGLYDIQESDVLTSHLHKIGIEMCMHKFYTHISVLKKNTLSIISAHPTHIMRLRRKLLKNDPPAFRVSATVLLPDLKISDKCTSKLHI